MNQIQRLYLSSFFLIFHLIALISADPTTTFSLKSFNNDKDPNFDTNFAVLGDAQIANGGNFVNLTSPSSSGSSSGQIVYKKPFKLIVSSSKPIVSFSTDFTFSITPDGDDNGSGDGLVFMIFPKVDDFGKIFDQGYFGVSENIDHKFVAVEFDTRKADNNNVGGNGNHVGIDVGSFVSAEISDVSSIGLLLNGGVPLKAWVDYEASSKRLEVRLAEDGSERPYDPLISYAIDMSKMLGDKDVLVGISSSSGNSKQISSLLNWSFSTRMVSSDLHSQPLNPDDEERSGPRKKNCFLTVLGAVIFATGCGTMVAFLALFVWVLFFGRHSNSVPELPMNQMDFKYEKVNVNVDNGADDATS